MLSFVLLVVFGNIDVGGLSGDKKSKLFSKIGEEDCKDVELINGDDGNDDVTDGDNDVVEGL